MSDDVIEPGGIPMFTGDLEQLTKDAAALTKQAGAFRDGGADVHKEFQGLSACYQAPEADQLFATTLPVKTKADDFADDLEKAAAALTEYEGVVRPLVKKLQSLRTEAFAFTDSIAGDDHWRRDQSKIDHNTRLVQDVGATVTAFTDAERACHDKITALVGGSKLTVDDGSHKPGMYGYSADMMKHAEETPWGGYAEREYTGVRWLWEQTKSFVWDGFIVDGVWGTIKGLGTLVGTDGWDKAGQAWTGLAKLATGLVITATPLGGLFWAVPDKQLPSWLRDSRTAMKETGKALVAWDEWGKNPARAAGGVTFNVLTTVFTGGAGSAAKGGAVAKVLSVTGKVAKVVDPMTYVAKAGKFGVIKVGDLFGSLKNVYSGRYADVLAGGGKYDLDGTYVKNPDVPVIKGNYVEWSSGSRLDLDEGTVYRPDGTVAPAKVELSADDIALLKSELPHVDATVPDGVKQPVLVGAGDRAGHVGDHPATPGTRTPGGTAGHTPGGAAHDLGRGAANDLDRGATGGSRGGAPSAGDTAGHAADTGAHSGTSSAGHGTGGHGTGGHDGGSGGHEPGHGGGAGDDAGHVPGGHDGTGGAGHDGGGGDGPGGDVGRPERQPGVILEGDRIGQQPSGPMSPEQEPAVAEALKDMKISAVDQDRMLTQLRKSGYGAAIADYISSGRFADVPNFSHREGLLYQVKRRDMIPAVHQAMEHAAELQSKGAGNVEFELKVPDENLDLDVLIRGDGRIEYGAQLKDVDSAAGIRSAVKKIAGHQLSGPGVDIKAGILDINGLRSELTERDIEAVQRAADRTNAYFELRFDDGSLTVYPTNATKR
ncbi:hypothetical protein OG432_18400 [Streptomyces sp. NBC_00442]|uniref:hypothetical protein n=1 Tax=Streptomyces sp. NBC_00442 TaxID=2903651 RepID=UPI002E1E2186